jgi:hypothetical protein
MTERTAVDIDELEALSGAIKGIDKATIALDSWAAGEATRRSVLELLAQAGEDARRALEADWTWLDERQAS